MSWELVVFFISALLITLLLLATIYQIFCLGDLESDIINAYDLAARINPLVTKEFVVQGVLCAFFLLTWHWLLFLISAPITYSHLKLYIKQKHLIDVTEVFRVLEYQRKFRIVKLAVYLGLFGTVIFRLVLIGARLLIGDDAALLDMFAIL